MAFTGNATCDSFKEALLNGDIDFASDEIKIALYTEDASLTAATTTYSSDNEVDIAGYDSGGSVLTPTVTVANNVAYVTFSNVSWSAAITARGALIYKTGGTAICVLDFGANKTSASEFVVEFPPANSDSAIIRIS